MFESYTIVKIIEPTNNFNSNNSEKDSNNSEKDSNNSKENSNK